MSTIGEWFTGNADLDRIDREVLLCEVPGITRARILAAPESPLGPADQARLDDWSARRRTGVPIAYLIGRWGFRDFDLAVSPAVLVPRPETELLVETAVACVEPGQRVLDLGTGSGAIAIALARETAAAVTGADVSADALAVAAANAAALGVPVEWVRSDWYSGVTGRFHVIASNPPYIAAGDPHLAALRHEPALALVSGPDGLDAIRHIIDKAPDHLQPGGWLVVEHGFDQGSAVRSLLRQRGFAAVETRRDLAGHDRVSVARLPADDGSGGGRRCGPTQWS